MPNRVPLGTVVPVHTRGWPAEKLLSRDISALVDSKLIRYKKCIITAKMANDKITESLRLQKTSEIVESSL